jgi:hypothetical protein
LIVQHNRVIIEALATDLIVDLYTFFRPPKPYQQLFVLDPTGEHQAPSS